jgi:hypothetical protein
MSPHQWSNFIDFDEVDPTSRMLVFLIFMLIISTRFNSGRRCCGINPAIPGNQGSVLTTTGICDRSTFAFAQHHPGCDAGTVCDKPHDVPAIKTVHYPA